MCAEQDQNPKSRTPSLYAGFFPLPSPLHDANCPELDLDITARGGTAAAPALTTVPVGFITPAGFIGIPVLDDGALILTIPPTIPPGFVAVTG
jgi:hypothetical protein